MQSSSSVVFWLSRGWHGADLWMEIMKLHFAVQNLSTVNFATAFHYCCSGQPCCAVLFGEVVFFCSSWALENFTIPFSPTAVPGQERSERGCMSSSHWPQLLCHAEKLDHLSMSSTWGWSVLQKLGSFFQCPSSIDLVWTKNSILVVAGFLFSKLLFFHLDLSTFIFPCWW